MFKSTKIKSVKDTVKTARKVQRRRQMSRITDHVYAIAALPIGLVVYFGARKVAKAHNS